MQPLRTQRVYTMARSSQQMLARATREAEAMVDQTLADDLQEVTMRLAAIVRAAEQRRYRSPDRLAA